MGYTIPYQEYLKKLEKDSLTLNQKFLITKIKQENKLPYDLKLVLNTKKETMLKSVYWGEENYTWYNNHITNTLLAYKVLAQNDSNNSFLPFIQNYFMEIKGQHKWRNTVETASILETILPTYLKQAEGQIKPTSVQLSGTINTNVSNFPFKTSILATNRKLSISKTGSAPVFYTSYHKQWNAHPKKKEDNYNIKTSYEVKGKKTDTLMAG